MGRQVKCPYCGQKFDQDEAVTNGKRYYHKECFEEFNMQKEHRKALIEYICEIYDIEAPTGMMLKQIKDYISEEYNYKYKGMELALRYFYETLDNRVTEGTGLGIIPFVYEDAKRDYVKRLKIAESANDFKTEERIVYIDTNETKRKNKKIDISAI